MLTPSQIHEAWGMRSRGFSWKRMGDVFGIAGDGVREALYPGWKVGPKRPRKRKIPVKVQNKRSLPFVKAPGYMPTEFSRHMGREAEIPQSVLVDRAVRMTLAPQSLTALIFGDPIPGRSALDQSMGRRPLCDRLKG